MDCGVPGRMRGILKAQRRNHRPGESRRHYRYSRTRNIHSEGGRRELSGRKWLGTNLDLGNYRGDPYGNIEMAAPYAVATHAKTDVSVEGIGRQDADFKQITKILDKAGYKGCLSIEYEGKEEPMTAMPKFVKYLKECVESL